MPPEQRSSIAIAAPLAVVLAWMGACAVGVTSARDEVSSASGDRRASLSFSREGAALPPRSFDELSGSIPAETVVAWDPYYQKQKRFRGWPLARVLAAGFPGETDLRTKELVFRAKDGYSVFFRGALAVEPGGYVAFADLDAPNWEPIGPRRAHPGPFYVVWQRPEQADLETHPRPWELSSIELVRFETAYPHTSPGPRPDGDAALAGYQLFRGRCFQCHAINREGGRVGPELNVPRNILEYRPEDQVRAYIRNPLSFRYGAMPPHPDFTETDLDALVAYLRAMQAHKHDEPH
jgi:mono/diheme cytochrome c family protein